MHDQPRKALKQENEAALSAKAEKLRSLQAQFLANHHNNIYSKEALDVSAKLLEANPECYTTWNYRRLAVQHLLSNNSDSDPHSIFQDELKLVEIELRKNFKSHGAWHHRKWVLRKGHSSMDNEMRLLNGFQKADPRNFRAWNYRRFVVELIKRSDEDELKYAEEVIGANFSNTLHGTTAVRTDAPLLVSSWSSHGSNITLIGDNGLHGCGLSLLSGTLSDTRTFPVILYFNQAVKGINSSTLAIKSELLKEELKWKPLSMNNSNTAQVWVVYLNLGNLELQLSKTYSIEINIGHPKGIVSSKGNHYGWKRATWMDTNLQKIDHFRESDSIVTADQNHHIRTSNWCTEEIVEEITKFQDLLSEYDCKIGRLTIARLLTALDMLSSQHDGRKSNTEEVLQLYTDLMKLDPTHSIYYKDECILILLKRITLTRDSLIPYCHYYKDATETVSGYVCLRLQNLSLSLIGSIQNLLCVQMLDLSHNKLRPIEGLGAMQLLSCLNLSHNKIGSFTALGPLRLLKLLKMLNISYNELGSHSIDTTRYLFSSPVAHTEEFAWDRFEILTGSFSATNKILGSFLDIWKLGIDRVKTSQGMQ